VSYFETSGSQQLVNLYVSVDYLERFKHEIIHICIVLYGWEIPRIMVLRIVAF
jgi:hypothetical protein